MGAKAHLLLVILALMTSCRHPTLTLATTTSVQDSGLLEVLLPPFEEAQGVKVKVVAVGSGQALELSRRGDADVLLVHDPEGERAFLSQGFGVGHRTFMYNDFVIGGPEIDPAGVRGMQDAASALARIARSGSPFISRGDNSGTHSQERALWRRAGLEPGPDSGWYIATGQGMGATLLLASEKRAYTLTDRSTFLFREKNLDLIVLVEGDETLRNYYSIMAVNPKAHPRVNHKLALSFIDFLTSEKGQGLIASYGKEKWGRALFAPFLARE